MPDGVRLGRHVAGEISKVCVLSHIIGLTGLSRQILCCADSYIPPAILSRCVAVLGRCSLTGLGVVGVAPTPFYHDLFVVKSLPRCRLNSRLSNR